MNEEEKELLEIYNDIFIGDTQLLALVATKAYNELSKTHNKEEISVIAEILVALSKAPVVVYKEKYAVNTDSILEAVDANFPMGADEALDLMEKNLDKEHLTKVMRGETSAAAEERLFAAVQLHQLSNRNTGRR